MAASMRSRMLGANGSMTATVVDDMRGLRRKSCTPPYADDARPQGSRSAALDPSKEKMSSSGDGKAVDQAFLRARRLLLRDAFMARAGWNLSCFEAAILMEAPVWGLRPFRAPRSVTRNLPNPKIDTSSPCWAASA